ncbi:class I SAM-dependent methyltransferase [Pseudarthrobacter niigatensis]|uniref:Ubiquinone/menaquinone biosynthesis C-methylase UbiE n=1 Tax=Pseudarthrobacter niigatensis TaxID=369935 RepID=A0AAJ1WCE5_9MICC|nr:class I SAM-dependent methyltransferase [Pseudarthrobacter niigatensis]MDQ0144974.1 ubiquinone/menaquinone biosynthesis C-methylase UbiE [Pseudarthrobacter niigatensis]MDQ0264411.1 ubiquinone/menaquinone biosynthesis C-methylase UbiE [Pseudarthrobacter niigatensis]
MDSDQTNPVVNYYNRTESKVGYQVFLGGTKHFGFYNKGDRMWSFRAALRRMEDRLGESLALPRGSYVLDAGCGMGDVASRLADKFGLRVKGIDILDFNVSEAQKRVNERGLSDRVSVELMDYSNLSFEDGTFDGVYTMETLVHASSPEEVLRGLFRVLKPGGRLVMFEYSRDPQAAVSAKVNYAFAKVNELSAMPSFQRFDHGVLEQLIAATGFEKVAVEDITANMLPMVHGFSIIGWVPYQVAKWLNKTHKLVNAMSAVEFWKYRKHFRYNIYTACKPEEN